MRENTSSTRCEKEPSFCRPDVRRIGNPFLVGDLSMKVALEQIGSHLCPFLTFRRDRRMAWTLRKKLLFSHQTSHAEASHNEFPVHPTRHGHLDSHTRADWPGKRFSRGYASGTSSRLCCTSEHVCTKHSI